MAFLVDLWLPILLSAVFVYIASSIIHMLTPIHKGDCKGIPGEEKVLEEMRNSGLKPGEYMFPYCADMKEMGSDAMVAKYNQGPVGFMQIMPNGPWAMGKSLGQWFAYIVLTSVFVAYIASFCLEAGTSYLTVFRLTGTAAMLGYAVGNIPNSIWKGHLWSNTAKFIFDGIVYSLITAGTFGWLWPGGA